eukprot:TRINITY_DN20153_c0_g1_i1.p2 TRINITY_DN20153_c0_g1~~TRINITY_DN20153_c0_g1_i1.p2  ORF type:complete len:105 (+),score=22.57 TRINITY_DN20153_c0_g1_i1:48-362(+)
MVVSEVLLFSVAFFGFRPTVKFLFRTQNKVLAKAPTLRSWTNSYTRNVFRIVLKIRHKVCDNLPSPLKKWVTERQMKKQREIQERYRFFHRQPIAKHNIKKSDM